MGRGPAKQRLTVTDAEFILAMAENGLSVTRAGKSMPMSYTSAMYHTTKIKRETGLDPRDFYGMTALLPLARSMLNERKE